MNYTLANDSSAQPNDGASTNQLNRKSLQQLIPQKFYGQIIGKIAKNFYYTSASAKIDDVANELLENENILAIGVIDDNDKAVGVIPRRKLFDTLGQRYGRDLYKNKKVSQVYEKTTKFHYHKNPIVIAEEIKDCINLPQTTYYLLIDGEDKFAGIFSSKDLLVYLSDQTQKDIMLAKNLQEGIIKEQIDFDTEYFEICGGTKMAKGIGGDFYTIQKYNENNWYINICDVSGKGVSAALVSVILGGMTRVYDFNRGLDDYIMMVNHYIYNSFQNEKFVTGLFLDLDEKTGKCYIYDLGHSYIYILRGDKIIQVKSTFDNIPIGLKEELIPKSSKLQLQKDDLLVMVTDGIEEQKNSSGKQYGLKYFFKIVKENKNDLSVIKEILFKDMSRFRGTQPQDDDITMIMLHYK